jgi:hypothetical protein
VTARFFKPDRVFMQYFWADPVQIGRRRSKLAPKQFLEVIDGNTNLYSQTGPDRDVGSGPGFLQQ